MRDVSSGVEREGGWAGPESWRASVLRHGEHQGGGRPHDRGDRQEKWEEGDDFKIVGVVRREHVDVRVLGQQRNQCGSRDGQRRRDASSEGAGRTTPTILKSSPDRK